MDPRYVPGEEIPGTLEQARLRGEETARRGGHDLGRWVQAGILWSFYDSPGPEEHATCTTCGASAVAKAHHRTAGSAITLSCGYTLLMRRLASRTRM
jgi:hypothetical protein